MSEYPFSPLEIQLIRSSLSTKTNEEIAELIEQPVETIKAYINEITGGTAEDRNNDVIRYQQEQALAKQRKSSKPKENPHLENKVNSRKKERQEAENQWEKQRAQTKKRDERRTYKTRKLDLENMISVKLDAKTIVLIEKQPTEKETQVLIDQARINYELRKKQNPLYKE